MLCAPRDPGAQLARPPSATRCDRHRQSREDSAGQPLDAASVATHDTSPAPSLVCGRVSSRRGKGECPEIPAVLDGRGARETARRRPQWPKDKAAFDACTGVSPSVLAETLGIAARAPTAANRRPSLGPSCRNDALVTDLRPSTGSFPGGVPGSGRSRQGASPKRRVDISTCLGRAPRPSGISQSDGRGRTAARVAPWPRGPSGACCAQLGAVAGSQLLAVAG